MGGWLAGCLSCWLHWTKRGQLHFARVDQHNLTIIPAGISTVLEELVSQLPVALPPTTAECQAAIVAAQPTVLAIQVCACLCAPVQLTVLYVSPEAL